MVDFPGTVWYNLGINENERKEKKEMKCFVTFKVEGRINVEVEADTKDEILEKAYEAFSEADLSEMDYVDSDPISYEDEDGNRHDL